MTSHLHSPPPASPLCLPSPYIPIADSAKLQSHSAFTDTDDIDALVLPPSICESPTELALSLSSCKRESKLSSYQDYVCDSLNSRLSRLDRLDYAFRSRSTPSFNSYSSAPGGVCASCMCKMQSERRTVGQAESTSSKPESFARRMGNIDAIMSSQSDLKRRDIGNNVRVSGLRSV